MVHPIKNIHLNSQRSLAPLIRPRRSRAGLITAATQSNLCRAQKHNISYEIKCK